MTGPKQMFGFGARVIAFVDTAATSPFAQLSMIPLLTLTAYYAPAGHRATWFALMASLMNLALVAGQLQTKYLNQMYAVGRGEYGELGVLLITVTVIGLVVPRGRDRAVRPAGVSHAASRQRESRRLPARRARTAASARAMNAAPASLALLPAVTAAA